MFPNSFTPVSTVLRCADGAWSVPEVVRTPPVLPVRAVGLHYGQVAFEALRAALIGGELHAFRPELHYRRLSRSLDRLSMPPLPGTAFGAALGTLLAMVDVPQDLEPGSFLYVRPVVVATDEDWSMSGSVAFELHVLAGWTQPAFHGLPRVRARIEVADRQALSGAAGVVKVPSNYGSSMVAQRRAQAIGAHTVLWLTPGTRAVEEFTSMNALVVTADGVLHAPPAGPGVLDGVIRRTVVELADATGVAVRPEPVAWPDPSEPGDRIAALLASATAAGVVGVDAVKEVGADGEVHTWRSAATLPDAVHELRHRVDAALSGASDPQWWVDAATLAAWPFGEAGGRA